MIYTHRQDQLDARTRKAAIPPKPLVSGTSPVNFEAIYAAKMHKTPVPIKMKISGRPPKLKRELAILFADNRVRTIADAVEALGGVHRNSVSRAMRELRAMSILKVDKSVRPNLWSRA